MHGVGVGPSRSTLPGPTSPWTPTCVLLASWARRRTQHRRAHNRLAGAAYVLPRRVRCSDMRTLVFLAAAAVDTRILSSARRVSFWLARRSPSMHRERPATFVLIQTDDPDPCPTSKPSRIEAYFQQHTHFGKPARSRRCPPYIALQDQGMSGLSRAGQVFRSPQSTSTARSFCAGKAVRLTVLLSTARIADQAPGVARRKYLRLPTSSSTPSVCTRRSESTSIATSARGKSCAKTPSTWHHPEPSNRPA